MYLTEGLGYTRKAELKARTECLLTLMYATYTFHLFLNKHKNLNFSPQTSDLSEYTTFPDSWKRY